MNKDFHVRKILIPYDFSETAGLSLEHAVFMAKLFKAEITLVHIVETVTFTSAISHALSGFEKKVESASNEKLQELADKLHRENGVKVNVIPLLLWKYCFPTQSLRHLYHVCPSQLHQRDFALRPAQFFCKS